MPVCSPAQISVRYVDCHVSRLPASCLQGCTALHEAASGYGGGMGVVKLLLANGADVNAQDINVSSYKQHACWWALQKPVTT